VPWQSQPLYGQSVIQQQARGAGCWPPAPASASETKAADMVSRIKGGKSFITLDDGDVPLPPTVIPDTASAVAVLSSGARVLVFGMDEMKVLTNGAAA